MSGIASKEIDGFKKRHKSFKKQVMDESVAAIQETRRSVWNLVASVLGSTPKEGGFNPIVPRMYSEAYAALSTAWIAEKARAKLMPDIGTATGDLQRHVRSMADQSVSVERTKSGSRISETLVSEPPGEKLYGSNTSQWFKFFAQERGIDGLYPGRPFFTPVMMWFRGMLRDGDEKACEPFMRAVRLAKGIVYGG